MAEEQTAPKPPDVPAPNVEGDDTPPGGTIPSGRLKEANDKRRAAESELQTLREKNAERERKELEDQGKFQEVIAKQNQELNDFKERNKVMMFDQAIERELSRRVKESDPALRTERVEILSKSVDRTKLTFADGQVTGLTEQITEMEGRSTFMMLFGIDQTPEEGEKTPSPANPNATTATRTPNNSTKTVAGNVDVASVRGMSKQDFDKAAQALGINPI